MDMLNLEEMQKAIDEAPTPVRYHQLTAISSSISGVGHVMEIISA
jgi:hypothetical protein